MLAGSAPVRSCRYAKVSRAQRQEGCGSAGQEGAARPWPPSQCRWLGALPRVRLKWEASPEIEAIPGPASRCPHPRYFVAKISRASGTGQKDALATISIAAGWRTPTGQVGNGRQVRNRGTPGVESREEGKDVPKPILVQRNAATRTSQMSQMTGCIASLVVRGNTGCYGCLRQRKC